MTWTHVGFGKRGKGAEVSKQDQIDVLGDRLEWRSRNSNAAHSRARETLRTVISHPEETSVVPPKKIVRVANDQFPGFADFWKRLDGAA